MVRAAARTPRKPRSKGSSNRHVLYTGKSGQLAVMSELVFRGYNTAIPEVDVGDDIFVIHDKNGDLRRVQVKTAQARKNKTNDGYRAAFSVRLDQLKTPINPELVYILLIRHQGVWSDYLIITRSDLNSLRDSGLGADDGRGSLTISVGLQGDEALCNRVSLQHCRNNWSLFPPITH